MDVNKEEKAVVIGTTRAGKPKITCEGYTYSFEKRNTKNTLNLWRCRHDNHCNARIHTDVSTNVVVARLGFHNHPPKTDLQEVHEVSNELDENIFAITESELRKDGELLDDELLGTGPAPSDQPFSPNVSVRSFLAGADRHDFNEKLIQEVKLNPVLYDPGHLHYSNFHKRKEVWQSIATNLCAPVESVKMRWRSLRKRFHTEWKRNTSEYPAFSKTPLGSFSFVQEMQFLISYMSSKRESLEIQSKVQPVQDNHEKPYENSDASKTRMRDSPSSSANVCAEVFGEMRPEGYNDLYLCYNGEDGHSGSFKEPGSGSEFTTLSAALSGTSNDRKRRYPYEDLSHNKDSLHAEDLMMNNTVDEDELFGQSVTIKLRKIADCTGKERLKMKILQCFVDYSEEYGKEPKREFS